MCICCCLLNTSSHAFFYVYFKNLYLPGGTEVLLESGEWCQIDDYKKKLTPHNDSKLQWRERRDEKKGHNIL